MSITPKAVKPVYPNVILKRIATPDVTTGGIIVPYATDKESLIGEVMAVYGDACAVHVGDTVSYKRYAGDPLDKNVLGFDGIILSEDDLTAVIHYDPDVSNDEAK